MSAFLAIASDEWVASNAHAFAVRDRYPVSPGHTLVISRRVVCDWFAANAEEQRAILALIDEVKRALDAELHPDGYNVGFNAGEAAGQTVMHLHVHVIPRYRGDMDDPRGGVRGVIPAKQRYEALEPAKKGERFAQLPTFVYGDDLHFEHSLRSALRESTHADIVSAFVQESGLRLLINDMRDALARGVRIRLLTGDYLGITSPDALRMLLGLADENEAFSPYLYEVVDGRAFHPKAYLFMSEGRGVAYVGSSNFTHSALTSGVEWNMRLVSSDDAPTFAEIQKRFEALLARAKPLTRALIDAYELRAPERPPTPFLEPRPKPPAPTSLQKDALLALKDTRRNGKTRGLVVLATGLGKTYLSAFDFKAMGGERALFVAHREEILGQAKDAWQLVFPDKVVGTFQAGKRDGDADLVFASVQTLARAAHLNRFSEQHFDYIVIDEFHHAAAKTYRKILAHFKPRFMLGLTATPERMDGKSLLELCDDNLVFRKTVVHGITARLLVPFHYFGVKDVVNYKPIPWRSGKFDAAQLTSAVTTETHAEHALREYERHTSEGGKRRTLCFCCTVEHADYMAAFFRRKNKQAVAVHSGPTTAPRTDSLRKLKEGSLEIICAVDVFNEGLDIPEIDTVLMLRPTESPVIFLQQLGRGLRCAKDKKALTVVDFIGNHQSFLTKPQSLLFLLGQDLPPRVALEKIRAGTLDLPPGCSINVETDALDLLASLVQQSKEDIAVYEYLTFRDTHGRRPTAGELFAEGVAFKPIKERYESWFDFVEKQGDLSADESRVLKRHAPWFSDLLRTRMDKAYKMTSLRALIDGDRLFTGMDVEQNARASWEASKADLMLHRELREDADRRTFGAAFVRKWRQEPLGVWAEGKSTAQAWFKVDGDSFVPTFEVDADDRDVFESMTEEIVALRLAEHRDRLLKKQDIDATSAPIIMAVSHSNNRPILRFDRERRRDIPEGPTTVEANGEDVTFDFKKIAVNVATRDSGTANVLPEILRTMFGPTAGQPGTRHRARLVLTDDGWRLEPDATVKGVAESAAILPLRSVPYYPDVKVACGAFDELAKQDEHKELIRVQSTTTIDPRKHFVVRADGDSMDGGETPIKDGDLVLCEWSPGASAESVEGKPCLLVGHDMAEATFAVIKVPKRTKTGWLLESWNPNFAPQTVPPSTRLEPVARVLEVVGEPRSLVLYGTYDRDAIAGAFGDKNNPSWRVGHRDVQLADANHTVLMVTLRKSSQTKVEHRYADRFLSPTEFQWESQASTTEDSLKGKRIRGALKESRAIHLFVQYESHQPFTYLGPVKYVRHDGEEPMRVRFELQQPLPDALWKMWGA